MSIFFQVRDVNHYEVVVTRCVVAPYVRVDPCERNDNVRSLSEESQDIELSVCKMNGSVLKCNFSCLDVDLKRRELHKETFGLHVTSDMSVDTK